MGPRRIFSRARTCRRTVGPIWVHLGDDASKIMKTADNAQLNNSLSKFAKNEVMTRQAVSAEIGQNLPWAQGAAGSNPAAPTNKIRHHLDRHWQQDLTVGTLSEQAGREGARESSAWILRGWPAAPS